MTFTNHAKDRKRADRSALIAALEAAGSTIKGNTATCPVHDDQHASGSIFQGEDGAWRFKCHGCDFHGDVFDILSKNENRPVEDLLREINESDRPKKNSDRPARVFSTVADVRNAVGSYTTVESAHAYGNPDTKKFDMLVIRCRESDGGKKFQQYKPVPGGFSIGAPPKPWPIYNRYRLRDASAVIVVEGEKCVEALATVGVVATTSPGGAENGDKADWTPLAGKTVYLWPDNDPPDPKTEKSKGIEHMRTVAGILEKLTPAPRVYWIDPEFLGLPPKGDAVEFLETLTGEDDKGEAVWHVVRELSESLGATATLGKLIEDTISGKRRSLEWPHRQLSRLSKSLFPSTMTLICGDPASSKSFFLLESIIYWHEAGIPVAIYELEDDRELHLIRALALMSGESNVTDDDWVRQHPDKMRSLYAEFHDRLESLASIIYSPPENQPTPAQLAVWVEERCIAGCRIVAIDPITYADFSDKPWKDDRQFLWKVSRTIKRYQSSLILVTHPRKGGGGAKGVGGMDDMAGGAAYPRHAQSVFWIHCKSPPETVKVLTLGGNLPVDVNRVVKIPKARMGKGTNTSVGFEFDAKTLRFIERGVIVIEAKGGKPAVKDPWGAPKTQSPNLDDLP